MDQKTLTRQRGVVKGKLTLFSKFVSSLSTPADPDKYIDLQSRTKRAESLLQEFELIQDKIEEICTDYDDQLAEREKFELLYYTSISSAKKYLAEMQQSETTLDTSMVTTGEPPQSVKLPDITLPTFNGDVTNWLEFRDTFEALIHRSDLKPIHKLKYLRSCLTDGALNVIASLEYCEESYQIAWRLICDRYNNPKVLITNHLRALFNIDIVQSTPSALRTFVDDITRHLRTLNNLKIVTENWDILVVFLLSSKLENSLQRKWEEKN